VDAVLTGRVWNECNEIGAISVTNAMAIGKEVAVCMGLMRDARKEVMEMKRESEGETGTQSMEGQQAQAIDDEDDDDLDGEETFSAEEYVVVPPALDLIHCAIAITRIVYAVILKHPAPSSDSHHTLWMESQLSHCRSVTAATDALTSSLYPPQSQSAIDAAMTSLCRSLHAMLSALLSLPQWERLFEAAVKEEDRRLGARSQRETEEAEETLCHVCGWMAQERDSRAGLDGSTEGKRWVCACMRRVHELHGAIIVGIQSVDCG